MLTLIGTNSRTLEISRKAFTFLYIDSLIVASNENLASNYANKCTLLKSALKMNFKRKITMQLGSGNITYFFRVFFALLLLVNSLGSH